MSGFPVIICTNCGYETWSVKETGTCRICGSLMVCNEPVISEETVPNMTIEELDKYRQSHSIEVIADEGKLSINKVS